MNAQLLELSEQLDCLFSASLHKIKLHIIQNISKISIHALRTFKSKNMCDLCDNILDRDKKVIIMVKKCVVLHEEFIDVFNENITFRK